MERHTAVVGSTHPTALGGLEQYVVGVTTMEELLVESEWPGERVHNVTIGRLPGTTIGSPMSYAGRVQAEIESAHGSYGQNRCPSDASVVGEAKGVSSWSVGRTFALPSRDASRPARSSWS